MNFKKLTPKLFCQSTALLCAAGSEHALAKSRQRIKPRKTCYSAQEFQDFPLPLWGAQICTTTPPVWCSDRTESDNSGVQVWLFLTTDYLVCILRTSCFSHSKKGLNRTSSEAKKGLVQALDHGLPPNPRRSSADPERFPPALGTQLYFRAQAEHTLSLMALNKPG